MKTHIDHFGCKGCGGTLGMKDGQRVVTCDYCGVRNLVSIEDHVPRYVISPVLSLDDAKRRAMRLTHEKGLPLDLPSESRFHDAGLYYLPIYEMTGVRTGKIIQTDVKRVPTGFGGALRTVENSKATVLINDVLFSAPAARLGDWGIENVPLEKQRQVQTVKPFDAGRLEKDAVIFDPNIPPSKFEDSKSALEGYLPGDQTRIAQKSLSIIFTPAWLIKYSYHNRLYRIVIDAVLGDVLFARAPAGDTDRIPLMLLITFLFSYPTARLARALLLGQFQFAQAVATVWVFSIPILLFLSIMLLGLAMAWNQFRYSGEMVWRGETREVERVNKPPETKIEKIARAVASVITAGIGEAIKIRANRWYE